MDNGKISASEYSALALDVYSGKPKGSKIYSWGRQNFLGDPERGFFAAAYQTPKTKKLVVAFRGTDEGRDWQSNISNTAGLSSRTWDSQLNTALQYFRSLRAIYRPENCSVCGHSLGGFLASMVAIRENVPAAVFNPAPLGISGVGAGVKAAIGASKFNIVNFRLEGDVVSGLRLFNIGKVIQLRANVAELWLRKEGLLGDVDPIMHSMALMNEMILRDRRSQLPPDLW